MSDVMERPRVRQSRTGAAALRAFPTQFADLPEAHREVLAILAASTDAGQPVVPRADAFASVVRAVATEGSSSGFGRNGVLHDFYAVVGNLLDYGLVQVGPAGLSLTADALAARPSWNGAFTRMVERAAQLV